MLWDAVLGLGPRSLANSCACVCVTVFAEGNLYAVGGYDSSSHLATVEKYEPQVNTRESMPGNPVFLLPSVWVPARALQKAEDHTSR